MVTDRAEVVHAVHVSPVPVLGQSGRHLGPRRRPTGRPHPTGTAGRRTQREDSIFMWANNRRNIIASDKKMTSVLFRLKESERKRSYFSYFFINSMSFGVDCVVLFNNLPLSPPNGNWNVSIKKKKENKFKLRNRKYRSGYSGLGEKLASYPARTRA